MAIRPQHQHVDMNGIVYLPYLNQWNNRLVSITNSSFWVNNTVISKAKIIESANCCALIGDPVDDNRYWRILALAWRCRYRLVVLCENMSTAFSALSPVYAKLGAWKICWVVLSKNF